MKEHVWYAGRWRTPEGVVNKRRVNRERQRRYRGTAAGVLTHLRRTIKEKGVRLGAQDTD